MPMNIAQSTTAETSLIACPDCDLLHRKIRLRDGETAKCSRCGAMLYRQKRNSHERTLALAITALILFVLSNVYPFMTFKLEGRVQENTLISGVIELFAAGKSGLAGLVFLASILVPLLKILGMLYVLLPLKFDRQPWKVATVFRAVKVLHPWAMMEVYMLGVFVAIFKLSQMATIVPGTALFAFAALIVTLAATGVTLDPRIVWDRLEAAP